MRLNGEQKDKATTHTSSQVNNNKSPPRWPKVSAEVVTVALDNM